MPPHPQCNLKLERRTVTKDVTNTHLVFTSKLPIHPNSRHPRPRCVGLARWPAAPPACTACRLAWPALHACSLRCLRVLLAASLRTPCALLPALPCTHHLPTQRCGWHDGPRPPATLCAQVTTHADERDPRFRPRRPCSHLRGARSNQDDQPAALQARPSHTGAHGGHRTLPYSRVHEELRAVPTV